MRTNDAERSNAELLAEIDELRAKIDVLEAAQNEYERRAADFREVEEALRISEERYRLVTELISDYAYLTHVGEDGEMKTAWATSAFYRLTGYTSKEENWRPKGISAFIHPDDAPAFEAAIQRTLAGEETASIYRHRSPESHYSSEPHYVWLEVHRRPIWDAEHKRVIQILGSGKDITGRKTAEDELRKLKEYHETVVHSMAEGIAVTTKQRRVEFINPAGAEMLGYKPHELVGRHLADIVHPDYYEIVNNAASELRLGTTRRYEFVALRKDNTPITVLVSVSPRLEGEQVAGSIATFIDISERKQVEESEREERVFAQALASAAAAINSTLNLNQVLDTIIDKIAEVVPHDGANLMLLDPKHNAARVVKYCHCYAKHGLIEPGAGLDLSFDKWPGLQRQFEDDKVMLIADTRTSARWVSVPDGEWVRACASAPIRVEGKVIGFLSVDSRTPGTFSEQDAARLQAFADQAGVAIHNAQLYQELQNYNEHRYQIISDLMCDYACSYRFHSADNDLAELEWVIGAFEQITGNAGADAFAGLNISASIHPDDISPLRKRQEKLRAGHTDVSEFRYLNKDGTIRWIRNYARPEWDAEHHMVQRVYVGVQDITELKQAEMALRDALNKERTLREMKSQMISMFTHDFRNPLSSIQLAAEMLSMYSDHLEPQRRSQKLNDIIHQTRRMNGLMEDMLTIGALENSQSLNFAPTAQEIYCFCKQIFDEVSETLGQRHQMVLVNEVEEPLTLWFDAKLMWKILSNLLSNAIKYSSPGSEVRLALHNDPHAIYISIADQGIGIAEADQAHLFETFFRAGNTGAVTGTGLGLAIVKQAVELHGGAIGVKSALNEGTTFSIKLPLRVSQAG